jgi:hypothetical protein
VSSRAVVPFAIASGWPSETSCEAVGAGLLPNLSDCLQEPTLNRLVASGGEIRGTLRRRLSALLRHGGAALLTAAMRAAARSPIRLSRADAANGLYWTLVQMVAHHTSNGCGLRPGDLIGSGTVPGDTPDSRGSLLELTRRGSEPLRLPGGEERGFLQDGDTVIMTARCGRPGFASIGFGSCQGTIVAAPA